MYGRREAPGKFQELPYTGIFGVLHMIIFQGSAAAERIRRRANNYCTYFFFCGVKCILHTESDKRPTDQQLAANWPASLFNQFLSSPPAL